MSREARLAFARLGQLVSMQPMGHRCLLAGAALVGQLPQDLCNPFQDHEQSPHRTIEPARTSAPGGPSRSPYARTYTTVDPLGVGMEEMHMGSYGCLAGLESRTTPTIFRTRLTSSPIRILKTFEMPQPDQSGSSSIASSRQPSINAHHAPSSGPPT